MTQIAKIATKLPWKRIAQTVVPVAIEQVLTGLKRRQPRSSPSQANDPLSKRIDKLEEDLEKSLEAVKTNSDDLARRLQEIASAAQIITLRLTITLVIAIFAALLAVLALIFQFVSR
jgi:hypothetical protein